VPRRSKSIWLPSIVEHEDRALLAVIDALFDAEDDGPEVPRDDPMVGCQ